LVSIAALWLALAIDHWLGEPPARWHPVVWIGRYLDWAGRRIAPPAGADATRDLSRFAAGGVAWFVGAVLVLVVAWFLTAAVGRHLVVREESLQLSSQQAMQSSHPHCSDKVVTVIVWLCSSQRAFGVNGEISPYE